MPWPEVTLMSLRREFVMLARKDDANMAQLCRRFGISRKTGYKWLARYRREGEAGLSDRSRRPRQSPHSTPRQLEEAALHLRAAHPAWGGSQNSGTPEGPWLAGRARRQHHHRDFAPVWLY